MKTSNFDNIVQFHTSAFKLPELQFQPANERLILFAFLNPFEPPYQVAEMIENYFHTFNIDRCLFLTPDGAKEEKLNLMSNTFTYNFFSDQNQLIEKYHESELFHTHKFVFTTSGKHKKLNYNIPVINALLDDWKSQVEIYGKC